MPRHNLLLLGALCLTHAAGAQSLTHAAPCEPNPSRVRWVFEMDRWMNLQFTAVAEDGTIYTSDKLGLYAVSPAGGLLWFLPDLGGGNPIDVADDGTIYTGTSSLATAGHVVAVDPAGFERWRFVPPPTPGPLSLAAGPNVAPDGNIYAVQDPHATEGLGVFSLDPNGFLRWSNRTTAALYLVTTYNSEFVFNATHLYVGAVSVGSGGSPHVFSFTLAGQEVWSSNLLNNLFLSYPRVDPQGRAIGRRGQTGLMAVQPGGATDWFTYHPSQINVWDLPTVDSQGNVYAGASRAEMWSVDPAGKIRWKLPPDYEATISRTAIAPDDSVIVAHHLRNNNLNEIAGYDPANGQQLWGVELETVAGLHAYVTSMYPRFSPDGKTAYVTTSSGNPAADYSRLYAIDITPQGSCYPDCDASNSLDFFDFLCFQNAFATAQTYADCDTSGVLDFFDFLCFQNSFAAGCP